MDCVAKNYEILIRKQIPDNTKAKSTPGIPHPIQYGQKQQYALTNNAIDYTPLQLRRLQAMAIRIVHLWSSYMSSIISH